uniref:Uncharacterized protein n=1 Tax=Amphimedon queenslandica TaxID=400682 RepID=A0A1X7TZM8_AMPQE
RTGKSNQRFNLARLAILGINCIT